MAALFSDLNFYFLLGAAFLAGFIDAIVGGGELIQLPAFFLAFPGLPPATILGSNKFAGFSGTTVAAIRYARNRPVKWEAVLPAAITAIVASICGAQLVSLFDKTLMKPLVLVLLCAVAVYTFLKKDLGMTERAGLTGTRLTVISLLTGAVLGLYDGFFGPGTGSFLIVIFISLFGFDFLDASVSAKLINCATNIGALALFAWTGNIRFDIAIPVALFNVAGSLLGVRLALLKGSSFIRVLFLVVVVAMIVKFAWDIFTA